MGADAQLACVALYVRDFQFSLKAVSALVDIYAEISERHRQDAVENAGKCIEYSRVYSCPICSDSNIFRYQSIERVIYVSK